MQSTSTSTGLADGVGLSYAGLAVVRSLYNGTMGGLQVPGDRPIARLGQRAALALATFIAAAGFLLMSLLFGAQDRRPARHRPVPSRETTRSG